MVDKIIPDIFSIGDGEQFRETALEVFRIQSRHNPVYREYIGSLGLDPASVRELDDIPYLPAGFFKTRKIILEGHEERLVFESSGTVHTARSKHYVVDPELYEQSLLEGFSHFYGAPGGYCILALLPSYLDNPNSSLIFMADRLIRASGHPLSGFFPEPGPDLVRAVDQCAQEGTPCLLLGVSFALIAPLSAGKADTSRAIIMETGGMKGRQEEITRDALHERIRKVWGVGTVHSEYGMTELLSQAYSGGNGIFHCPPWMKVTVRDLYDPFDVPPAGTSGGINIIDLANAWSCSFVETMDLGMVLPESGFRVLGRIDNSDIRGCNLLYTG